MPLTQLKCEELERVFGQGIFDPTDDEQIAFYARAVFDYDMGICDADDWAWLNTLFRYDIGYKAAAAIIRWYYEEMDSTVMDAVSVDQKETLQNICEFELGLHLDFSHWPKEEPKALEYGFRSWIDQFIERM